MNRSGHLLRSACIVSGSSYRSIVSPDLKDYSVCPSLPIVQSIGAPSESIRVQSERCPIATGPAPVGLPCDPWVGGTAPVKQTPGSEPIYTAVQTTPASATTARRNAAAVYQASQDRFAQYRSTYVAPPDPIPSLPNPVPVVNPPQCIILRYEGSKPPT
jgi:hypothetical protein